MLLFLKIFPQTRKNFLGQPKLRTAYCIQNGIEMPSYGMLDFYRDLYKASFQNIVKITNIQIMFNKSDLDKRVRCQITDCQLRTNKRCQNEHCLKVFCNLHSTRKS